MERILLVGFMGSGKTRVGEILSKRLDWEFRDFDQEIERRLGLSIPEIFRQHGEGFFRSVEAQVGAELLQKKDVVLAAGGGWPARAGRMDSVGPTTLTIWLRVTGEEALRRTRQEGPTRPLLAVPDPAKRAKDLLRTREPFYSRARVTLDANEASPEELAETIEDLLNEMGGR